MVGPVCIAALVPSSAGLPSSATASRPSPRSAVPEVKSGLKPVCTTNTPGLRGTACGGLVVKVTGVAMLVIVNVN